MRGEGGEEAGRQKGASAGAKEVSGESQRRKHSPPEKKGSRPFGNEAERRILRQWGDALETHDAVLKRSPVDAAKQGTDRQTAFIVPYVPFGRPLGPLLPLSTVSTGQRSQLLGRSRVPTCSASDINCCVEA